MPSSNDNPGGILHVPHQGPVPLHAPAPSPPIVNQPSVLGAVAPQNDSMSHPRGFEYLTRLDKLLVKMVPDPNVQKFVIKNNRGQEVFYVVEDTDCCTSMCVGGAYDMKVLDNDLNEFIHMYRPSACTSFCFRRCPQTMEVASPRGNVIGTIEQKWSLCTPHFWIKNNLGDVIFRIEGPFSTFSICGNVEFAVLSGDRNQIGKISKKFGQELLTNDEFFGVTFPMDSEVRMKAVLLGATFLINAMFFQNSNNLCFCLDQCV